MTPVSESPATALPIALLSSAEPWRNSLLFLNHHGRSTRFNALIAKFTVDTNAIPGEDEWNDLVLECMLHRAVKPLTDILAENPLQTLSITRPVETTDAWKTLEAALPASCSILHLVVSHQNLSEGHASLLLSIMG